MNKETRIKKSAALRAGTILLAALGFACGGAPPMASDAPHNATPHETTSPCTAREAAKENMRVTNSIGTLEGTLLLPEGCEPAPVVFIIPGSGPTDRDGNQPGLTPQPLRLLAEALAERGVGSLRYDKAGVGASAGAAPNEADMRFDMGAADAALFIEALRADPRVGRLTVVGHSEGALLGVLAAKRAKPDALVYLTGAGRPIADVLREQLAKGLADPALLEKANAIIAALERGERADDVPTELMSLFRPSVQGYLISWMKYDPARELASAEVPSVLIVHGSTDIQASLADAERLAGARPGARLAVIEGMNHVLKMADASPASQSRTYTDPDVPIAAELVSELEAFASPDKR